MKLAFPSWHLSDDSCHSGQSADPRVNTWVRFMSEAECLNWQLLLIRGCQGQARSGGAIHGRDAEHTWSGACFLTIQLDNLRKVSFTWKSAVLLFPRDYTLNFGFGEHPSVVQITWWLHAGNSWILPDLVNRIYPNISSHCGGSIKAWIFGYWLFLGELFLRIHSLDRCKKEASGDPSAKLTLQRTDHVLKICKARLQEAKQPFTAQPQTLQLLVRYVSPCILGTFISAFLAQE